MKTAAEVWSTICCSCDCVFRATDAVDGTATRLMMRLGTGKETAKVYSPATPAEQLLPGGYV